MFIIQRFEPRKYYPIYNKIIFFDPLQRYKIPPPCKFFAQKMQKKCNKTILRGYTYIL